MIILDFLAQNWWILAIACVVVWIAGSAAKEALKPEPKWYEKMDTGMRPGPPIVDMSQPGGVIHLAPGETFEPIGLLDDVGRHPTTSELIRHANKQIKITCAHCGVTTDQTTGTCDRCGAPL